MDLTWLTGLNIAGIVTVAAGSSLLTALLSHALTRQSAAAQERRRGYTDATRALIRRVEYAYRIRRRSSDDPATLADLVQLGHDIQVDLAACRVWIRSESRWAGDQFDLILRRIDTLVQPCAVDAWQAPAATTPAQMNLGDWGPTDARTHLHTFAAVVAWRFGIRRLAPRVVRDRALGPVLADV